MPGTTSRGYPYPLDGEPVSDGGKNIRDLANKVNDQLGVAASGRANVTLSNSASGTVAVPFPAGRFSAAPTLVPVCVNTTACIASHQNATKDGATIMVRRVDNVAVSGTIAVDWIARQA